MMRHLLLIALFIMTLTASFASSAEHSQLRARRHLQACEVPWNGPDINVGNQGFKETYTIDTTCISQLQISLEISHIGDMETSGHGQDTLQVFYQIDDAEEEEWLSILGDEYTRPAQISLAAGTTITIRIIGDVSFFDEEYQIRNFVVGEAPTVAPTPSPAPTASLAPTSAGWQNFLVGEVPTVAPTPSPAPTNSLAPTSAGWQFRKELPIELGEMAAASDGTYVYVLTGHVDTWDNIRQLYRYDPSTDEWTTLADQDVVPAVNHAMVQYLDGRIYQIGGFRPETNQVAIYDIATDTWSTGTPLLMDGADYTLASAANGVIDGKIYVAGGLHNNNKNDFDPPHTFVYDPNSGDGGSWTQLADMPPTAARNHGCGVGYRGKLYVFGGRPGPNGGKPGVPSSLVYDPAKDEWSFLADIPTTRSGMGNCVELNGELYVIGGENPGRKEGENLVEAYNPDTNTWTTIFPLQVGRHGIYPVKRGNAIHVVAGGDGRGFSNSNWHEIYSV